MKRDVAIVGAGYVGLPLARTFADAGKSVLLVDVDAGRVAQLNAGESYIEDVPTDVLKPLVEGPRRRDDRLRRAPRGRRNPRRASDATLTAARAGPADPRLGCRADRHASSQGHVVVLESTTYPGTTREQVQPILEAGSGLVAGRDFHPRVLARARRPGS